MDWVTGRMTTSANDKKNNLVLNGGSSLRELVRIVDGLVHFSSQRAVDATGRTLVSLARRAWLSRQIETVDQTVLAILALPLDPQVHAVAHYYKTLAICETGTTEQ